MSRHSTPPVVYERLVSQLRMRRDLSGGTSLMALMTKAQVIDKDAASALLARLVGADMLLLLTDAPAVLDPTKWPAKQVQL